MQSQSYMVNAIDFLIMVKLFPNNRIFTADYSAKIEVIRIDCQPLKPYSRLMITMVRYYDELRNQRRPF